MEKSIKRCDMVIVKRGRTTKEMCAEDTYAYRQTEPSVYLRQQDPCRQRSYAGAYSTLAIAQMHSNRLVSPEVDCVFQTCLLFEVAMQRMRCEQRMFKKPGYIIDPTYIRSAFWMVDKRCTMAIVVLPFAAWSRAAYTTFSEFESSADVA